MVRVIVANDVQVISVRIGVRLGEDALFQGLSHRHGLVEAGVVEMLRFVSLCGSDTRIAMLSAL